MSKYIVTFPVKYGRDWDHGQTPHPILLDLDARHDWVEVEAADAEEARSLAFAHFGQFWAFVYSESDDWMPELYAGRSVATLDAGGIHLT